MNETVWFVVELIGFILAAVLFVVNIILFVRFHVPQLVGELTGKKFEREVRQIREANEERYRHSYRGSRRSNVNPLEQMETAKQWEKEMEETASTTVLSYDATETMVLSERTSVLNDPGATTVLEQDSGFEIVRDLVLIHTDERIL